jgi:hypothetical protein
VITYLKIFVHGCAYLPTVYNVDDPYQTRVLCPLLRGRFTYFDARCRKNLTLELIHNKGELYGFEYQIN